MNDIEAENDTPFRTNHTANIHNNNLWVFGGVEQSMVLAKETLLQFDFGTFFCDLKEY